MDPTQKKQGNADGELSINHEKVVFDEIPETEVRNELLGEDDGETAETGMAEAESAEAPVSTENLTGMNDEVPEARATEVVTSPAVETKTEIPTATPTGYSDLGTVNSAETTNLSEQTNEVGQARQMNQMSQTSQMRQANLTNQTIQPNQVNQANQANPVNQANLTNQMGQANTMNMMNQMGRMGYASQANPAGQINRMSQMNQMNPMGSMRQVGFAGPISSGTGDIVVGNPEPERNSKMKIIIGIVAAVVVVFLVGMGAILMVNQRAENKKQEDVASLQQMLEGGTENFQNMVIIEQDAYDGGLSLRNFFVTEQEYEGLKQMVEQGEREMHALQEILDKDESFPKGDWNDEAKNNYTNLREDLNSNGERYEKLAQFTLDVVGTLQDEKLTVDKLAQYDVPELKQAIEGYFKTYKEFCPEGEKTNIEICDLGLGIPLIESEEVLNAALIQSAYRTVGGEMAQIGDYSVIYYLNNFDLGNGENK